MQQIAAAAKYGKRLSVRTYAFIRLGRFLFLVGGFVMYGLGLAVAFYQTRTIDWIAALVGQLIVTCTQLMVHYANDYYDFATDQVNTTPTRWSGGSRVLQAGALSPRVALVAAVSLGSLALMLSFLLAVIVQPGPFALPLLLLAIGLSWGYSAPPLRLHARGLGELSGVVILSILTPGIGFYLQTDRFDNLLLLASVPLYFLQLNMLLSVELPDVEGDTIAGKHTLGVRWGRHAIGRLYLGSLAAAYAVLPILRAAGLPVLVTAVIWVSFPVAAWQAWRIAHGDWSDPAAWNRIAFCSIALLIGVAVLELVTFVALAI